MPVLSYGAVPALVVTLLLAIATAAAHEGHDHELAPAAGGAAAAPRAAATSASFELLAVAREGRLDIYLDRFATNEPVEDASVEIETPAGPATAMARAGEPYRVPAPWLRSGRHDLMITVAAGGEVDVLTTTIEMPPPTPASARQGGSLIGSAFAAELTQRLRQSDSALLAAALGGFLLGVLASFLTRRRLAAALVMSLVVSLAAGASALAHEGEDHGLPQAAGLATALPPDQGDTARRLADGAVFVPKPTQRLLAVRTVLTEPSVFRRSVELAGRIIPDPNASGLVQASAGGRLSPPRGGFARLGTPVRQGEVLAYVTAPLQAIDISTMRQQAGDLDQQISILERRVGRYEQLAQTGAGTRTQLDEARLELQGLRQRRAALERTQREPEPLIAPVAGVIAEANAVAGQMAQPNERIFQIVDPARLWVEALSFEALAATRASARTSGGRNLALSFQGAGLADRNQAVPVHFAIKGATAGLRIGQLVTVLAETEEETSGLAVPRSSIVRGSNGQDLVYEHTGAERFEPREVRVAPLDAERVLIVAGMKPQRRIVTQGAELLGQIR